MPFDPAFRQTELRTEFSIESRPSDGQCGSYFSFLLADYSGTTPTGGFNSA